MVVKSDYAAQCKRTLRSTLKDAPDATHTQCLSHALYTLASHIRQVDTVGGQVRRVTFTDDSVIDVRAFRHKKLPLDLDRKLHARNACIGFLHK